MTSLIALSQFFLSFLLIPPENVRKPLLSAAFMGDQKRTLPRNGLNISARNRRLQLLQKLLIRKISITSRDLKEWNSGLMRFMCVSFTIGRSQFKSQYVLNHACKAPNGFRINIVKRLE